MTDPSTSPEGDRVAEARRVADRLRRRKRGLERRNPLNDLDAYREGFREVVALEAELRSLRSSAVGETASFGHLPPPIDEGDAPLGS